MSYSIQHIAEIIEGDFLNKKINPTSIEHLLLDSRQITFPSTALFFAIKGKRHDGHQFLKNLYQKGVRNFIVEKKVTTRGFKGANFILVKKSILALQQLAQFHRSQFDLTTITITGSNGKTIVKEWLSQILQEENKVVASPKSYNSQIGVPLSIWQIQKEHEIGIFEAGISTTKEMQNIAPIIQGDIGIFTNIGDAHNEGFKNIEEKIQEKLLLFENCKTIIYCKDDPRINHQIQQLQNKEFWTWSKNEKATLQIISIISHQNKTTLKGIFKKKKIQITIPFTDAASIENAIQCWSVLLFLNKKNTWIKKSMQGLTPLAMRLEIKRGVNGCTIINDSYNADLASLKIALNYLEQQGNFNQRTLILSDFFQIGKNVKQLYITIAELIVGKNISKVIGVGDKVNALKKHLHKKIDTHFYKTTSELLQHLDQGDFQNENILLKGARKFTFEVIADRLSQKNHKTILEINLTALTHNLTVYNRYLKPKTKLMAMVKANAYGCGSLEVAKLLEFQNVDYLAVAYADEGVELRKAGITLPILVLNPEEAIFEVLKRHDLEPEIYSMELLKKLVQHFQYNEKEKMSIHLKFDTGMHRLGFEENELDELVEVLKKNQQFEVRSIFSHLAGSEADEHDEFTQHQINTFQKMYKKITSKLKIRPIRHILNSSGINRFSQYQMEMVRLGIGLYGIDSSQLMQKQLQKVHTLKATISQIKQVAPKETIGYSRKGKAKKAMRIATISIGYADGLMRSAGNGRFSVMLHGKRAKIIGNVCMDMCMIDISKIPEAGVGDEVLIFGKDLPVEELAKAMRTISYEVFTGISGRVKRIYFQE